MTPVPAIPATPGEMTDAWVQARLGKLSASRIADVVGRTKKGDFYASREKYMFELIAERFTGMMAEGWLGGSMLWGIETEPAARKAYAAATGEIVVPCGYVDHHSIPWAGCSPDALVGDDGYAEIKCPEARTHIKYIAGGVVPEDYIPQMHWQMACRPERKWNDFCSFDPRMPPELQLFRVRLERDEKQIAAYEKDAVEFLLELSWLVQKIENGHLASEHV